MNQPWVPYKELNTCLLDGIAEIGYRYGIPQAQLGQFYVRGIHHVVAGNRIIVSEICNSIYVVSNLYAIFDTIHPNSASLRNRVSQWVSFVVQTGSVSM